MAIDYDYQHHFTVVLLSVVDIEVPASDVKLRTVLYDVPTIKSARERAALKLITRSSYTVRMRVLKYRVLNCCRGRRVAPGDTRK